MKKPLLLGLALCVVAAVIWLGVARPWAPAASVKGKPLAPLSVETTSVLVRPMPIRLQAVGQVESEHVVQVRPQVTGELTRVAFTEGDEVAAGQLLFELDRAPFEAALAQARAVLARDQATLDKARWQQQRTERLAKDKYVTPQDVEDAKAAAKVAAGAVAVDRAAVTQAQIRLRYTEIRSPIAGRTGAIAFREGNVVEANSATPLVTINQLTPIRVRFSVSQERLDEIRRYRAAGTIRVLIPSPDAGGPPLAQGRLVFVDNGVDPLTGTVLMKAEFPNAARRLWPGQYVTTQMVLAVQADALVVPDSAVQPGQNGSFVYVVRDGRARATPVTVARQLDGLSVISAGLEPGAVVVARLPRGLRDGRAVKAVSESRARKPAAGSGPERAPTAAQ